jgi:hypothetical protein
VISLLHPLFGGKQACSSSERWRRRAGGRQAGRQGQRRGSAAGEVLVGKVGGGHGTVAGTQVQQQQRRRRAHLPPAAPRRRSSRERLRHPKDRRCAPAHQCRQTGRQAKQGARNSEPRVLSLTACCVQAQCPACLLEQPAAERVDQAANGANDDCTVRGDDSAAASNGGQACRAGVGGGWRWELARRGNGSGGLAINTERGRLQQQGRRQRRVCLLGQGRAGSNGSVAPPGAGLAQRGHLR